MNINEYEWIIKHYWIWMKKQHVNKWINEYEWKISVMNEVLNLDEFKWMNKRYWIRMKKIWKNE